MVNKILFQNKTSCTFVHTYDNFHGFINSFSRPRRFTNFAENKIAISQNVCYINKK